MSEMACNVGVTPRTGTANVAVVRGLRVILNASGTLDLAGIGVRGDYVAGQDIVAAAAGTVYSMAGGGLVAAQGTAATNVADLAYSAANGQFSNVSTNAVLVGRWVTACPGANALGEVELLDAQ